MSASNKNMPKWSVIEPALSFCNWTLLRHMQLLCKVILICPGYKGLHAGPRAIGFLQTFCPLQRNKTVRIVVQLKSENLMPIQIDRLLFLNFHGCKIEMLRTFCLFWFIWVKDSNTTRVYSRLLWLEGSLHILGIWGRGTRDKSLDAEKMH